MEGVALEWLEPIERAQLLKFYPELVSEEEKEEIDGKNYNRNRYAIPSEC